MHQTYESSVRPHLDSHPILPSPSHLDHPHISGYMIQQRSSSKNFSRPATAPATQRDGEVLLPSISSGFVNLSRSSSSTSLLEADILDSRRDDACNHGDGAHHMLIPLENEVDVRGSLTIQPFVSMNTPLSSNNSVQEKLAISSSLDCDWATFITAYAAGRWDPHRTPNPPMPCTQVVADSYRFVGYESVPKSNEYEISVEATPNSAFIAKLVQDVASVPPAPVHKSDDRTSIPLPPSLSGLSVNSTGSIKPRPSVPLRLPTHRFRNSFSASSSLPNATETQPPAAAVSDVHATVATMRWAAARVDISPLALPSPEHELTDPMRGVVATIPGSHSQSYVTIDHVSTPGGTRRSRLNGFWEGTTDVDNSNVIGSHPLETIIGSPSDSNTNGVVVDQSEKQISFTFEAPVHVPPTREDSITPNPQVHPPFPPPATAPIIGSRNDDIVTPSDYFGDLNHSPSESRTIKPSSSVITLQQKPSLNHHGDSLQHVTPSSVPALPRRVCLTRQTSSPLPGSSPPETRYLGSRAPSESITTAKLGRAAKEERMFADLGYLAPPHPPDELERRRALFKFNILNTGPDTNFDRIAHLAKLVFSTKGVFISLIDSHEQWFKSESGLKTPNCVRAQSFCGHTILQRGDEPMVVLDALKDWRFEMNPLTIGSPHIRFYAGAPLRTQDGYNIGTLAVIDDQPREEFSPRQRHTLKEFAAIAMREMELWSDKIQLRIRSRIQNSMEQFTRECLEIDNETQGFEHHGDLNIGSSMDKMYDRAAKLVQRTLDVEGVIVMDVSHCEVLESMSAEGSVSVTLHHGDPGTGMTKRQLTTEEYRRLNEFFEKFPDGRISEGIVPSSFKPFLPTQVQYALTVPIFNIDKRPFALLCAYNTHDHATRFLEGYELSYLRAIGVIILSAVLKRRMILADKAKGLFISNISHELRTPLHGILAAAELLSESSLNHAQASFLQTVQACGTSLVETVNHVLDFTKLSGNSKAGGVENVIVPAAVDLMQLVEEAVDGCWIGHKARTAIMDDSGIGSVYAPPKEDSPAPTHRKHVETIIDIGPRSGGWVLKCEKGGIRRVLMNLFGNSLKFTSNGYIHVILRQIPLAEDDPPKKVKVELAVYDTGKGISQNFLKNQLFHPFTQENPLQTGTGLGLAIVSSIVTSENVGGKVDVWSEEGVGTEIKVTFLAEVLENESNSQDMEPIRIDESGMLPTISLVGLNSPHKGTQLLRSTLETYITSWWNFQIVDDDSGDIVITNDDPTQIISATEHRDASKAYIILSGARGNPKIMLIAEEYERIGGFCRILYKPGGPSRLRAILRLSIHALKMARSRGPSPLRMFNGDAEHPQLKERSASNMHRRNSEEASTRTHNYRRPAMTPRSSTAHPATSSWNGAQSTSSEESISPAEPPGPTISLRTGGTLLKSSLGSLDSGRSFRVLVVEDNSILRNLLIKWLSTKGYEYHSAVDGQNGVDVFQKEGPFDVVLLDLSMPVLDGVGATVGIRKLESEMKKSSPDFRSSCILALTGMSSLEDKRRAFEAGVDGYLVKPVAFKTLNDMFRKLGVP